MDSHNPAGRGLLCLAALLALSTAGASAESDRASWLRWTADADWEYFHSDSDNDGFPSDLDSLRQRYSVGLGGILWDPRFNTFDASLDFYRTDTKQNDESADSSSLGYRISTTFFPSRPFSVSAYGRRMNSDVTAAALASNDRDTNGWGGEMRFLARRVGNFRARFDRSRYELLSPLLLQERRKMAQMDYDATWGRNDLSFRYSRSRQQERIQDTDYRREDFLLTNRTEFQNGSVLLWNARNGFSDARYASGQEDDLINRAVATAYDLPRGPRWRLGWNYDYNDVNGMFVDSTSHLFRTRSHVHVGERWDLHGNLSLGRVESQSSTAGLIQQELYGMSAGVRRSWEWTRVVLGTGYSIGYDVSDVVGDADRRNVSHRASINLRYTAGEDEYDAILEYDRNRNDTTGVGYTADGSHVRIGWERRLVSGWRVRAATYYRGTMRDTFDFGLQKSDEIGIEGTMSDARGGFSVRLLTRDGISDFIPDPGVPSPVVSGSDLVNRADIGSLDLHWMIVRNLRLRTQVRLEDREYSSIGHETIVYYNPQLDYIWHYWTFGLGLSHYERNNDTGLRDDTILIKITRRFF